MSDRQEIPAVPEQAVPDCLSGFALGSLYVRVERFRAAHSYRPPVPAEAHYNDSPDRYLSGVREAAGDLGDAVGPMMEQMQRDQLRRPLPVESRQIDLLTEGYLNEHPGCIGEVLHLDTASEDHRRRLEHPARLVMANALRTVAFFPRSVMFADYDTRRESVLNRYIGDPEQATPYLRGSSVLGDESLDGFCADMTGLEYAPTMPDMLRLPLQQQKQIAHLVLGEALDLCGPLSDQDPDFDQNLSFRLGGFGSPLIYMTASEIENVMSLSRGLGLPNILDSLWRDPVALLHKIETSPSPTVLTEWGSQPSKRPGTRGFALHRLQVLGSTDELNSDAMYIRPGISIGMSPEDVRVPRQQITWLLSGHLDMAAYSQYIGAMGSENRKPPILEPKIFFMGKIKSCLIPKGFNGDITNLMLTELEVTDDWRHSKTRLQAAKTPETARRFLISATLLSSASGHPIEACVEVGQFMQTTQGNKHTQIVREVYAVEATMEEVRRLVATSRRRAVRSIRVFSGGLPSLGKRR